MHLSVFIYVFDLPLPGTIQVDLMQYRCRVSNVMACRCHGSFCFYLFISFATAEHAILVCAVRHNFTSGRPIR